MNEPAGKKSSWKISNRASNATAATTPATTIPAINQRMPVAIAAQARSEWPIRRAPTNRATNATTAPPASRKKPANTPRTSRMWARSRSSSTGAPATSTANVGGPSTRS